MSLQGLEAAIGSEPMNKDSADRLALRALSDTEYHRLILLGFPVSDEYRGLRVVVCVCDVTPSL